MKNIDQNELDLVALGKRIRQLRIAKGYQDPGLFAAEQGIAPETWLEYEKGYNIHYTELLKVCAALDITIKVFFRKGWDEGL